MAIVLPHGRPAIDIVKGTYERPEDEWAYLGDPEPRARLEAAIAGVGRVDYVGHDIPWDGTAFVVGKDLVMTPILDVLQQTGDGYTFKRGQFAVIDFGHEREPAESVRVTIEAVVAVDPRWRVGLMKATLPETVTPLSLSILNPDALAERDVVVLGYPAWDARNDPALMQRLFRGAVDVKRMMPGRVRGPRPFAGLHGERDALGHDCTSTGGCGNAPLVDVQTGHVVGLQFAGRYLDINYAVPASDLAANSAFVNAGVQFAGLVASGSIRRGVSLGPTRMNSPVSAELSERLPAAPTSVGDTTAADAAAFSLERIVFGEERPALLIREWRTEMPDRWRSLLTSHEKRLDLAARAVGKLVTDTNDDTWIGSAFLVGDRLALTASFAVQVFAKGAGTSAIIRSGVRPGIDFSEALGLASGDATVAVTTVKFIHPYFQLALLQLERMPEGVAALDLAAHIPSELSGRAVAVLSFAARDSRDDATLAELQESLYKGRWGALFLQPGKALQVGQIPGTPGLPALVHDCTTTIGSVGAPVLDLGTGYVIGVHTHAKWLEGGFAQPTWELARDPNVWPYGIAFRPDPRPPWIKDWDALGSQQPAPVVMQPPAPAGWTVDDVPIDWSRSEPKELERLLVSIDAQMALYSAENAGLPLGTVNAALPGVYLWREIIKKASLAGVLRRLLEDLASAPQNAGIATKLRTYL